MIPKGAKRFSGKIMLKQMDQGETDSIQLSVSRQSVMRIGVPCVPLSKRTKRAG